MIVLHRSESAIAKITNTSFVPLYYFQKISCYNDVVLNKLKLTDFYKFCYHFFDALRQNNIWEKLYHIFIDVLRILGKNLFCKSERIFVLTKIFVKFAYFCLQSEIIGVAGGEHRESPPPRNGKNCCRKMMLFPKTLFLATTFPKIVKIQFSYWIFIKNFQKFLKIFQLFVFFVQTREKLTHGL